VTERVVEHFVIPRRSGKAFRVSKGQILRVRQEEGGQVAGLIVLNAHNYKEQGMARFSGNLSQILGTGNHYRLGTVFSKVPYERAMLTVTRDTIGHHFLGPHCTGRMMEIWGAPGHRSCSDNFADALAEVGLTLEDVYSPAAINLFANTRVESTGDGRIHILSPDARKGDLVDFHAEMDVLIVASACPDDISALNGHSCKSIGIQIVEEGSFGALPPGAHREGGRPCLS
jgi:uncharacterized protein YcgI (DUF1989 family)